MSRAKRARFAERFAALPLSVMTSTAFRTLPVGHQRVLWLLAAQFDGTNNGNLTLTRKQARHFGLNNERARCGGLRELEHRGLIIKTRAGGIAAGSRFPTTWALAFRAIQHRANEELAAVQLPSTRWRGWTKEKNHDTQIASSHDTHSPSENGDNSPQIASSAKAPMTRKSAAPLEILDRGRGPTREKPLPRFAVPGQAVDRRR
jgi:hypothetical protein